MADEVDRFLDLADRFEPRLADLDQAGDRNIPFALLEDVRSGAQKRDAARPAHVAPCGIGRAGRFDRLVDKRCVGLREFAEDDVAVDRARGGDDLPFSAIAPANECRPALAEQPRFRLGNDRIEMRVNAGKILAGVRISDARKVSFARLLKPVVALQDRAKLIVRQAVHRIAVGASHRPRRDERVDDGFLGRLQPSLRKADSSLEFGQRRDRCWACLARHG